MTVPGGMIIGCGAGLFNSMKGKGVHTAMKSGILAAETISEAFERGNPEARELSQFNEKFRKSWIWEELHSARNYRAGFSNNVWVGLAHSYFTYNFFGEPKTLLHMSKRGSSQKESEVTELAKDHKPI